MAYDKIVDSAALDAIFAGIANAIRQRRVETSQYAPEEMAGKISGMEDAVFVTRSGNEMELTDSLDAPIQSLTLYGISRQNGIPAFGTPVPIVSTGDGGSLTVTAANGEGQTRRAVFSTGLPLYGIPAYSGGNVTIDGQCYVADTLELLPDGTGQLIRRCILYRGEELTWTANHTTDYARFSSSGHTEMLTKTAGLSNTFRFGGSGIGGPGVLTNEERGKIRIGFASDAGIQTVEDLMAWFAENPTIFLMALAEPEVIALSEEDVAELKNLHTFGGLTQVSNDGGCWMDLRYAASAQPCVDALAAEYAQDLEAAADTFVEINNNTATDLTLPLGATKVRDYLCYGCNKLVTVTVPMGPLSVGQSAFRNCTALTAVTFRGRVSSISATAFQNCPALTAIYVPWAEGEVANAPWGATNAAIVYNYAGT